MLGQRIRNISSLVCEALEAVSKLETAAGPDTQRQLLSRVCVKNSGKKASRGKKTPEMTRIEQLK
jgi:hypothetical protein